MKDRFSIAADQYRLYRPTYPDALFECLNSLVPLKMKAWDVGTGNGQVASVLAATFDSVFATDISQNQLDQAPRMENVYYSAQSAERTDFPDHFFDLITVAQAIHWFDFNSFYHEVKRTAKQNALIAVMGYGRIQIDQTIDEIISRFYFETVGPYWDAERKYVDENYQTIPFPFEEIRTPLFEHLQTWTLAHLLGYLNTWSAVKNYQQQKKKNPVDFLSTQLEPHWSSHDKKVVRFPILLRLGKIQHEHKNP